MKSGIFNYQQISPFKSFGLEGDFWMVNIDTLVYTWIAMLILFGLAMLGNHYIHKKNQTYISIAFEKGIEIFIDLCKESFPTFNYKYFAFVTTVFLFTCMCSFTGLFPFLEESTKDLNTTFALGLTIFIYVQYQKIKTRGILGYLKEFLEPIFFLAPINIIGELAKIASMSFRLFGNILGGDVLFSMIIGLVEQFAKEFFIILIFSLISLFIINSFRKNSITSFISRIMNTILSTIFILTWIQMFFGIFEGLIQAFVLTVLSITYLAMGTSSLDESPKKTIHKEISLNKT